MHGKPFKLTLVGVAVVLLVAAGFLQQRLNRQRTELGLTRAAPLENAPPVLAFTTVALVDRGLIANALWVRANDLDNGRTSILSRCSSPTGLRSRSRPSSRWLVQAWNIAYNISVKFRDPYDRWRWVQQGIELLRDQGLKYNPKEALIYRELAWFFQHKMGQNLDDAHLVYKYEWAKEITRVLGSGRPNYDELLNPQTPEARQRVELLREAEMDSAVMKKADELYGPLEWRLPEASAIYWAMVGLEKSNKKDLITLRRVIYQSLHMNVMRGRIVAENPDGTYTFGPDLGKIGMAQDGYSRMLAEETDKKIVIEKAHRELPEGSRLPPLHPQPDRRGGQMDEGLEGGLSRCDREERVRGAIRADPHDQQHQRPESQSDQGAHRRIGQPALPESSNRQRRPCGRSAPDGAPGLAVLRIADLATAGRVEDGAD